MKFNNRLLLLAAFFVLALPLILTGNASAMYMTDGAAQNAASGGWNSPTDGVCVLSLDISGNMVTDPSKTTARDCQARLVTVTAVTPNDTLANVCGNTTKNIAGLKYAAPGSSTCVTIDGSGYITGSISMVNLDRNAVMCNLLGGQLANATAGTLSNGAVISTATKTTANGTTATCIAYGFQYKGQDANGTPLAFGAKGTAQAAGTGYCYSVMDMTSAGYTATTCPMKDSNTHPNAAFNSSTAYDWNWTGTKCTYNKGIAGYLNSALTHADGTTTGTTAGTFIDLSTKTTMGDCLAIGASWANWTGQAAAGTTSVATTVASTIPAWDYTKEAPDGDAGCLHCHSTLAQHNGPVERQKDSYLKTGHKNMLRKVTAGKNWAGPDGVVYTTDGTNPISFTDASITVASVKQNLYYVYGDWMIALPSVIYGTNGFGNPAGATNGYSCYACHATGASDNTAPVPGVQSIGTPGYAGVQPGASFPGINLGAANPKWNLDGIQCARCHNATVGKVVDTQIAASAFPTTQPTSGGMGALTSSNQGRTDLCFGCHQSMAKSWPSNTTQFDPTLIPTGASHGAAYGRDFNGHVLGNSFLNSVHGKYTGTVVLNALGKYDLQGINGAGGTYASKFKGYACYQSTSSANSGKTKNTAGDEIKTKSECESLYGTGSWRADNGSIANGTQGTCATCHDVHNSLFVDSQAEAALRKTCDDCHVNNATTFATDPAAPQIADFKHPTALDGTPFDTSLYESACVVCHMAEQAEMNGNQNTMPTHVWRINTDESYNTFPTSAQFYGGSCSVGSPGNFTTPPQYTTSGACTTAGGVWTPTAQNRNATMAPDGTYANAVWVDLDLACGQCHGGSLGSGATHNGAMYYDKHTLSTYAQGMHEASKLPPTPGYTGLTVIGKNVKFTDASMDNNGKAQNSLAITVNWNDGNVSTGAGGGMFTHTYAGNGKFNILHTAKDSGNRTASEFIPVTVGTAAVKYNFTVNVVMSDGVTPIPTATLNLKKSGVPAGMGFTNSSGIGTFSNLAAGTYTITVYKSAVDFDGLTAGKQNQITPSAVVLPRSLPTTDATCTLRQGVPGVSSWTFVCNP